MMEEVKFKHLKKNSIFLWRATKYIEKKLLLPMREFNKPTFSLKNIFHQIVWKGAIIMVNITREE